MSKPYKELPALVKKAKQLGFQVRGGSNGGGWFRLAAACGLDGQITKTEAKEYLRKKLGVAPASPGRIIYSTKAPAVAALEAKLAAGNNWSSPSPKARRGIDPNGPEFLDSYEWKALRMKVLTKYGPVCMCCGATRADGEQMHVDHIKPRRKRPDLALVFDNLQVLCGTCNHGKGNWDETDWRPVEKRQEEFDGNAMAHLRLIAKV